MIKPRVKIVPLVEFPEYGVSSDGHVWRLTQSQENQYKREAPFTLRTCTHAQTGVLMVTLYQPSTKKPQPRKVSHLVAEAFIGQREGRSVRHKNGDATDNRAANLYYEDESNVAQRIERD